MRLLDKVLDRLELYRLERRYTKRKNRTSYVSEAQYIDGEYIYSPTSPTSSVGGSGDVSKATTKIKVRDLQLGFKA